MAEVAELLLLPLEDANEEDELEEQEEAEEEAIGFEETLDRSPHCSSSSSSFDPVFSLSSSFPFPGHHLSPDPSDSEPESDYLEDRIALSLDPFDCSAPQETLAPAAMDPFLETLDSSDFRVLDGVDDMGSDYLGLGRGLGLGLGFERQEEDATGGDPETGSDWGGDGLFVGNQRSAVLESGDHPVGGEGEGLRVVGFGSDSDSEEDQIEDMGSESNGIGGLCWDCLRLDEDRRDPDEDFEWEEVDGHLDEREVLSMMVGADDVRSSRELDAELEEDVSRNVAWEVLLAVNHLERNPAMEAEEDAISDLGDDPDFINPSEYEILFGQFMEHDSSLRGSPPAAKLVVENLPSIVLTEEDKANNNTLCAVCKDEIPLEERAKKLPCSHHYHGECIMPWLGIRNTCPVCRYELPTDDPEYESWRARRGAGVGGGDTNEAPVRYDLEMFDEVL